MKKMRVRAGALLLSAAMLFGVPQTTVFAANQANISSVTVGVAGSVAGTPVFRLDFSANEAAWLKAIAGVSVNGTAYKKDSWISMMPSANTWYAEEGFDYSSYQTTYYLRLTNDLQNTTDFLVSAAGYDDVVLHVEKNADGSYTASVGSLQPSDGTDSGDSADTPVTKKPISLDQVSLSVYSGRWRIDFTDADDYVSTITSLTVNGAEWEAQSYDPYTGGKYYKNTSDNQLRFIAESWTVDDTGILKSGDVIHITSSAYEDLEFKFVRDGSSASLVENDGEGDIYQLYVKMEGSFASAIVGEKEYDAVSAATGMVSSSSNSNVKISAAVGEKGLAAEDVAWEVLDLNSSIQIDPNKTKAEIVPDTANGTPADSDSGLGVLYSRLDSGLTVTGTPKDAGRYLVSVTITDTQGRTATSNSIPLVIYSGQEKLADEMIIENMDRMQDGKYIWHMEPWNFYYFGSNVEGESESVRVPAEVKAWYGSSESGLYGNLGYAIPWSDVEAGNIPQTLYIPSGCDLTFVNMEIQSSVRIVVEDGGKLTLRDSVVQGIIDVESGGTFSMNYDGSGGKDEFLTGSSVDGQIHLQDGAIIENAAIVSHTNYIANGDLNDRNNTAAVVVATGDVTVKGKVFISGDESGTKGGQTGLLVKDGTLHLEDDAVLAVYGGDAKVTLYYDGGNAIQLSNGNITGNGKVIAVGGAPFWGNGGNAVVGNGTISTAESYLQGASAISDGPQGSKIPGKTHTDNVKVTSKKQHVEAGPSYTVSESLTIEGGEPLYELYWKTGIDPQPDLSKYPTIEVGDQDDSGKDEEDSKQDDDKDDSGKDEDNSKQDGDQDDSGKDEDNSKQDGDQDDSGKDEDDSKQDDDKDEDDSKQDDDKDDSGKDEDDSKQDDDKDDSGKDDDDSKQNDDKDDSGNSGGNSGGSGNGSGSALPFTDVPANAFYRNAVKWAVDNNVTSGTSATTFSPDRTCTRGEAVTLIWRANGSPKAGVSTTAFTDIKESDFYYEAVLWATEQGITVGTSAETFSPDQLCSRSQIVAMLYRAEGSPEASGELFTDVRESAYYADAVRWAVANEITRGTTAATFSPDASCTRAQMVTFIYRQKNL